MATIVLVTSQMAGRVNICVELRQELSAAGHTVHIASPYDIAGRLAELGAEQLVLPEGSWSDLADTGGVWDKFQHRATRLQGAVDRIDAPGITAALLAVDPDLIVCDVELSVHVMAAHATGRRLVLWTSMMSLWKQPGVPPPHTPNMPGDGFDGSPIGIELAWRRFQLGKAIGNMRRRITRVGLDRISVLRAVAKQTGFPFDTEASVYDWLVPFTFRTLPVLGFTQKALDLPGPSRPNLTMVGPMLNPDRLVKRSPEHDRIAAELSAIYQRRSTGETSHLLYCAFGAWRKGDDIAFFRRIVEAMGDLAGWEVVIGLGSRLDADSLGPFPANIHVFPWAPQLEVLQHADVALHHAGISSVQECIAAGVPMLLYPFDFLDQPGNAVRVAYHGAGIVGSRTDDTAGVIRENVLRVAETPEYRAAAAALQNDARGYRERRDAVAAIEAHLPGTQ